MVNEKIKGKPTIEELERILEGPPCTIQIKPDGSIEAITNKELCEVNIHFKVPKEKRQHILNARDELLKAGITFDTGASLCSEFFEYDWEFDWSLKGGIEVNFRRFKQKEGK